MFLNYPNNPTGATVPEGFFEMVVSFAREHEILVVHDNAYSETTYDGYVAPSFLATPGAKEVGVEVFSLSKGFNMTGWRCAAILGNAEAIQTYWRLKTNVDSGLFEAVQMAGVAALRGPERAAGADERDLRPPPRPGRLGACARSASRSAPRRARSTSGRRCPSGHTSTSFCEKVLEEAAVVVSPGSMYGPSGEGFFRISLTTPDERIDEAVERMREHLGLRGDPVGLTYFSEQLGVRACASSDRGRAIGMAVGTAWRSSDGSQSSVGLARRRVDRARGGGVRSRPRAARGRVGLFAQAGANGRQVRGARPRRRRSGSGRAARAQPRRCRAIPPRARRRCPAAEWGARPGRGRDAARRRRRRRRRCRSPRAGNRRGGRRGRGCRRRASPAPSRRRRATFTLASGTGTISPQRRSSDRRRGARRWPAASRGRSGAGRRARGRRPRGRASAAPTPRSRRRGRGGCG